MTEDQNHWEITEPKSSNKCKWKIPVKPDRSNGVYNDLGEVECIHPLGSGQRCCIKNKTLCPIRTIEVDYPMNPERQVNKDDV